MSPTSVTSNRDSSIEKTQVSLMKIIDECNSYTKRDNEALKEIKAVDRNMYEFNKNHVHRSPEAIEARKQKIKKDIFIEQYKGILKKRRELEE